ncbi:MAG: hypothetical protein GY856_01545 [bacterium]|nr:hypothetical protein [bacterium]
MPGGVSYTVEVIITNPYVELTAEFNRGRLRAVLSSGQAVVLYRLAIMSKDGDWILREDTEALTHVLRVLAARGARYRFGAPLDVRWLAAGWSSHFEIPGDPLRLRTDFVTRPPRLSEQELGRLWQQPEQRSVPMVGIEHLAQIKKTNREKDYAVIGELARLMSDPRSQFLYSRSSRDLARLAQEYPQTLAKVIPQRPLLATIAAGRDELERALDEERRRLMRANEERLARYLAATVEWSGIWPQLRRKIAGRPLEEAHDVVTARAEGILPFVPPGGPGS